jgi:hypothetical protein
MPAAPKTAVLTRRLLCFIVAQASVFVNKKILAEKSARLATEKLTTNLTNDTNREEDQPQSQGIR